MRFEPGEAEADSAGGLHERLRIRDGNEANRVSFDVAVDSTSVEFVKDRSSNAFEPRSSPLPLVFAFVAPEEEGSHKLFIEVSQKNRLVQVVPASMEVRRDKQ